MDNKKTSQYDFEHVKKSEYIALEKKHSRTLKELKRLKQRNMTGLGYERFRIYLEFESILEKIVFAKKNGEQFFRLDGFNIPTNDLRYETFLNQTYCVECGLKASFIAIERSDYHGGIFHLNLYSLQNGIEVLMTRDHILPKSQNGSEHIENMQTMCTHCNGKKGAIIRDKELKLLTPNCYKETINI